MTTEAFLGVRESCAGRKWVARAYDERLATALAQRFTLPDILARSMAARQVGLDDAEIFLEPRLRDALPDPSLFRDMDKAAARLVQAVENGEKITVFGDYDVDGATSAALLLRLGRALGQDWGLYVPDRTREGYGPNVAAMRHLAETGTRLCLCVDCGTTAHEPLQAASEADMDVVVLDHHAAEPQLPPAVALVNPNRLDDPNAEKYGTLAAVGVTYLFVIAVNRLLRNRSFYQTTQGGPQGCPQGSPQGRPEGRSEPDLLQWLDLVALGTVCDVVKLTGLNRVFVAQGLRVMQKNPKVGLRVLAETAGLKGKMDTYAAGYVLGPRVNAGGRVGKSDIGARLLSSDDRSLAELLASDLHALNEERRAIETTVLTEAEHQLHGITAEEKPPLIFVAGEGWHAGVIGIVASRLKEKYHRPAIVVALDGDEGKGSGRSLGSVDLGAAVIAARQAGLLVNGGGHKMAAGLTVMREQLDLLHEFLRERIQQNLLAEPLEATLTVDGIIGADSLSVEFLEKLAALAPFGTGNPEPRFVLANCKIIRTQVVGQKHVSVIASQASRTIRAIAFRAMENDLGPALLNAKSDLCHLAGHVRVDDFRGGTSAQLILDDMALSLSGS